MGEEISALRCWEKALADILWPALSDVNVTERYTVAGTFRHSCTSERHTWLTLSDVCVPAADKLQYVWHFRTFKYAARKKLTCCKHNGEVQSVSQGVLARRAEFSTLKPEKIERKTDRQTDIETAKLEGTLWE